MIVVPTIFSKDFGAILPRIEKVRDLSRWIQVDVTDGLYTPGKTFELELLNKVERAGSFLWDVHLMVKEPERWIEKCIFVGASRVIGQVEMMKDSELFVNNLKEEGLEAGLGFDIETELTKVPEETNLVLLMARKAGFEERPIDETIFDKVKKAKDMGLVVAVDGGIDVDNYSLFEKAGADIVYCGSHYFEIKHAIDIRNN